MKIMLDNPALMPTRGHADDAGLDIRAAQGGIVRAGQYAAFGTGLHVQIPRGYVGEIRPRSGLMFGRGILTGGTIDVGYTGEVRIILFNFGGEDFTVQAGDRIAQLVVTRLDDDREIEVVDALEDAARGNDGFGSTGR